MRPWRIGVSAALVLGAIAMAAPGRAAELAIVQGRVATRAGAAVAGAVIELRGTRFRTVTGADGAFTLVGVPAAAYQLHVTSGASDDERPLIVRDKSAVMLAITLHDPATNLKEVVITASPPTALEAARATQQDAPNIVLIQPQAEIQKLPDLNAAEALRRIPGISLETDSGEGRFVVVRGLDSDLNGTTFGGVRLPATNIASPLGGGRAVAFDAIPASFIGKIEVTKTVTPDQDAEALGGTIEITPKEAPSGPGLLIQGKLGGGYEPLRNTPVMDTDLTLGGRFGLPDFGAFADRGSGDATAPADLPFSALATAAYFDNQRGVDDFEPAYSDPNTAVTPYNVLTSIDFRRYVYHRRRYGYGGSFGYDPDPLTHFYFRYSESGYDETADKHILTFGNLDNASGAADAAGNLLPSFAATPGDPSAITSFATQYTQTLTDSTQSIDSKVIAFGGSHQFERFTLDLRGSFAQGSFGQPYSWGANFQNLDAAGNPKNATVQYNNVTRFNQPSFTVVSGDNPADPRGFTLNALTNAEEEDRDREWSGVANVTVPATFGAAEGAFKSGLSLRLRDKTVRQTQQTYTPLQTFNLVDLIYGSSYDVYYNRQYQLGYKPNNKSIRSLVAANPGAFSQDFAGDAISNAQSAEHDSENIFAGYGMYTGELGPWSLLAGIRFEQTDATYRANLLTTDPAGNVTITPNANRQNYFDYFPTVQGRYRFDDALQARLSYSTAIARPGFNQITASKQVDFTVPSVTTGNPDLKPTTGNSFDFSLEYYLNDGGVASVGLFDKEFQNYIVPLQNNNGTYPNIAGAVKINGFENAGSAQAYGLELNYEQKFTFLPEGWNGFGIRANYTYVDSSVTIRPGEVQSLPSTSQHTFNAGFFYENYGFAFEFATSYTGENLFAVGPTRDGDTFSQPRLTVDTGVSYDIDRNFTAYFAAKNLTDTPLKFTQGPSDNRPIQREFYDVTLLSGVRFSFE